MESIQVTARRAGALYFVFMLGGLVDMFGFSGFVVAGNAAATARNITAAEPVYRLSILTDVVTLVLFLPVVVTLYDLLQGVGRRLARLMVVLVLVGVAVGLAGVLGKVAALTVLDARTQSVLTEPQRAALALACVRTNGDANAVAGIFWGLWLLPFGTLVMRSGYLPRWLGVLLLPAGVGWVASSATRIALPEYAEAVSRATMPLGLGELPIIFWLLLKGAPSPLGVETERSQGGGAP